MGPGPAGPLPAELTPGKIDTGAITRLENLVRSIHDRPGTLGARVDRLRKEVEVSAGEQDTTFEAAGELDALKERNRALTELMRLVAADRPNAVGSGEATNPDAAASAAAAGSASDDAARKHAALVAEAETTYNQATEKVAGAARHTSRYAGERQTRGDGRDLHLASPHQAADGRAGPRSPR